jgi:hypothetical protein
MIEGARSHPGPHREPHAQTDLIYISESSINISHRPAQIGGTACSCQQFVNHALQSASATATRERLL